MRFFYLDASALVKRYAPETGSPLLNHLLTTAPSDRLVVLNVGVAEVVSILVRKKNGGKLSPPAFAQALVDLGAEISSPPTVRKVEVDNALVTAAMPLILAYSVNSNDALVLCSALNIVVPLRRAGDDLVLVAADKRLLKAAQAQGLVTFNPETQAQADLDALLVP